MTRVAVVGPVSVGVVRWLGSAPARTLVVRVTLAWDRATGALVVSTPTQLDADVPSLDGDTRFLAHATDLTPPRPGVDVFVVGHYPPPARLPNGAVRLTLDRWERVAFVVGEVDSGGGVPVGRGSVRGARSAAETSTMGPISALHPERARAVGEHILRANGECEGPFDDTFDFAAFHAAPLEQRLRVLPHGASIEAPSSTGSMWQGRLPPAAPWVVRALSDGRVDAVELRCDAVSFDLAGDRVFLRFVGTTTDTAEEATLAIGLSGVGEATSASSRLATAASVATCDVAELPTRTYGSEAAKDSARTTATTGRLAPVVEGPAQAAAALSTFDDQPSRASWLAPNAAPLAAREAQGAATRRAARATLPPPQGDAGQEFTQPALPVPAEFLTGDTNRATTALPTLFDPDEAGDSTDVRGFSPAPPSQGLPFRSPARTAPARETGALPHQGAATTQAGSEALPFRVTHAQARATPPAGASEGLPFARPSSVPVAPAAPAFVPPPAASTPPPIVQPLPESVPMRAPPLAAPQAPAQVVSAPAAPAPIAPIAAPTTAAAQAAPTTPPEPPPVVAAPSTGTTPPLPIAAQERDANESAAPAAGARSAEQEALEHYAAVRAAIESGNETQVLTRLGIDRLAHKREHRRMLRRARVEPAFANELGRALVNARAERARGGATKVRASLARSGS